MVIGKIEPPPTAPFSSDDLAIDHLRQNHANPGGYWTSELNGAQAYPLDEDPALKRCIENAVSPSQLRNMRPR